MEETRKKHFEFEHKDSKTITPLKTDMKIVVPTLGREEKQKFIYTLPDGLKKHLYVATKEDNVKEFEKHNPGFNVISLPNDTHGVAQTRQRIIDILPKGKIWMVDDLTIFQKRQEDIRLKNASSEELYELYNDISEFLDYYIQVGISPRAKNNFFPFYKKDVMRSFSSYGLRTDLLEELEIHFDDMYNKNKEYLLFEDYYLTLSLLSRGYPNTVLYEWAISYEHNKSGGNSMIRTNEVQEKSVQGLKEHFPQFVKARKVESKGWKTKNMEIRTEPSIQWKKTFMSAFKKQKELF